MWGSSLSPLFGSALFLLSCPFTCRLQTGPDIVLRALNPAEREILFFSNCSTKAHNSNTGGLTWVTYPSQATVQDLRKRQSIKLKFCLKSLLLVFRLRPHFISQDPCSLGLLALATCLGGLHSFKTCIDPALLLRILSQSLGWSPSPLWGCMWMDFHDARMDVSQLIMYS